VFHGFCVDAGAEDPHPESMRWPQSIVEAGLLLEWTKRIQIMHDDCMKRKTAGMKIWMSAARAGPRQLHQFAANWCGEADADEQISQSTQRKLLKRDASFRRTTGREIWSNGKALADRGRFISLVWFCAEVL